MQRALTRRAGDAVPRQAVSGRSSQLISELRFGGSCPSAPTVQGRQCRMPAAVVLSVASLDEGLHALDTQEHGRCLLRQLDRPCIVVRFQKASVTDGQVLSITEFIQARVSTGIDLASPT